MLPIIKRLSKIEVEISKFFLEKYIDSLSVLVAYPTLKPRSHRICKNGLTMFSKFFLFLIVCKKRISMSEKGANYCRPYHPVATIPKLSIFILLGDKIKKFLKHAEIIWSKILDLV